MSCLSQVISPLPVDDNGGRFEVLFKAEDRSSGGWSGVRAGVDK